MCYGSRFLQLEVFDSSVKMYRPCYPWQGARPSCVKQDNRFFVLQELYRTNMLIFRRVTCSGLQNGVMSLWITVGATLLFATENHAFTCLIGRKHRWQPIPLPLFGIRAN